jgi:hypothetical protein
MDSVKVMTDVQSDDELNTLRGEITRYEERVHTGGDIPLPFPFIGLEEALNRLEARLINVLNPAPLRSSDDEKCADHPDVPVLTDRLRVANDWLDRQIGRILDITNRLDV